MKNYTSRLHALQSKYGFENTDPEPAAAIANSASLKEAASAPISTVTDQYQTKLRQLQQQYGANKDSSAASSSSPQKASSSLDAIRARMQATI